MSPQLTLSVLGGAAPTRFAVVQLPPDVPLPALGGAFLSLTRTPDEFSLVCEEMFLTWTVSADIMRMEGDLWVCFIIELCD